MTTPRWMLGLVATLAVGTTPAHAGGWFSRDVCAPGTRPHEAKPIWRPELRQVDFFENLDCHGLAHFAEAQRQAVNQAAIGAYMRPLVTFGTASAPAPASTPVPAEPPTAPAPTTPVPLPDTPK